jgi:Tol biopolymer transport system component
MRPHFAPSPRLVRGLAAVLLALPFVANTVHAQYFGRNKVNYNTFPFRIVPTDHYQVYFYPSESLATNDALRMAERWYVRHGALLNKTFDKNPLIFYADPPDFQQSNVIEGQIGQGTGGVTEGAKDRVIMPFTGVYAESDHVLGHELVHVFQYRIAESMKGGMMNVERIPLWLIEGMAEYLSLGRNDPNTAMWLRDALRRKDLPTIKQLTTDARFFPYRYGQALWAFIGGTWGDETVGRLYRNALQRGWDGAISITLGMNSDSLSKLWKASITREYGEELAGRAAPNTVGHPVEIVEREGDQNVSPAISPDGKYMAFFSSRGLFGIDLYVAEVATGHVVKQLTSVTRNEHFDDLSFIASAGSWSPDAKKLAFVVYAEGDNELDIMDVDSRSIERRVRVPGVGALTDPAWSPDGDHIAFSGMHGGISDLYLYSLSTKETQQLTNDREAQLQPAWSPDGRTLAFTTDAGPETDFGQLRFGKMRIALMDMTTHAVTLVSRLGSGKSINPQFSPDGKMLYFVSDQDGVSDIYRFVLSTGEPTRVTRIATGVSGITSLSPTLSVARQSGDLVFSVFDRQGFSIRSMSPDQTLGTVVTPVAVEESAGLLPPMKALATSAVMRGLRDPSTGLPGPYRVASRPAPNGLSLDYVGGPSVGVGFGGAYGTGLAGGVALSFSDMLGNQIVNTVVQANGTVKDIGAEALYLNRARRLNWGFEVYHVPYAGAFASFDQVSSDVGVYTQIIQREFFDNGSFITQYPVSTTQRFELSAGVQRISFNTEVDSFYVDVFGNVLREARGSIPSGTGLTLGTGSLAFVGDYSFSAFVGPVAGGRYRLEASPNFGSLNFQTLLADYRHYFFMRPFTLAVRAMHYGRYGTDAESNRMQPLYVGQPSLIRGYDVYSFAPSDCTATPGDDCPQFTRLSGSKLGVANAEFRIPLFGTSRFGLLNVPFLPTEVAPFVDVGAAWNKDAGESWRFSRSTTERVPVFSTGVTARFNLLGFAVVEAYWAHPYQRPNRSSFWGFQLAPGW